MGEMELLENNLPTTVSSALAESWSRVVFVMQVYTPASFSVTSMMVRLSDSRINLGTESLQRLQPRGCKRTPGHQD